MKPDLDDDRGDWTAEDYARSAGALFGEHPLFGETAHAQALAEGDEPLAPGAAEAMAAEAAGHVAGAGALRFYRRGGATVARGVLGVLGTGPADELARLRAAMPRVGFDEVHVVQARRTRGERATPTALEDGAHPAALHRGSAAPRVDMRPHCSPVGDQGQTLRCDAFAWTHALELAANVRGAAFPRLSCSFTMLQFLRRQGEHPDFRRAYLGGGGVSGTWQPGELLLDHGTCRATLWANDTPEPEATTEAMTADARAHVLTAALRPISLNDAKRALAGGWAVQLSMQVDEAFSAIGRDGVFRMPKGREPAKDRTYHAMLCVGHIGNFFIVKNSWGARWGDHGYCYLPKAAVARSSPELVAMQVAPHPAASEHERTSKEHPSRGII